MKKIVASVSLVAVGAAGLQAGILPGMTPETGKPWTVSATLRGFYDDNVNTLPNNYPLQPGQQLGSYGYEISPTIDFIFPMEQTTLSFGYAYSFKYYESQPPLQSGKNSQTSDFHGALTHAFSERYSLSIRESFVIGQEPDFLRGGNTFTTFQRVSGDNMRNYGSIDFAAQLTPKFGLELGYGNTWYAYANDTYSITSSGIQPSTAGLLDDIDNIGHVDGRYRLRPQTIGVVGFQFRQTLYTGDQPIGLDPETGQILMSNVRNARSYYGYVGLDHNFQPNLTGSIRAGARWTDYYNNPTSQNDASPYAMMSVKYTYLPESFVQLGGSYDYSSSSIFSVNNAGDLTLSAQAGTVFGVITHRIVPKLFGSLTAQYQNSTYYGGTYDGKADNFYLVGLNLRYQFTPNFSAEAGYNFDDLVSTAQPNYNRNRVYIGVTGSY
jgi:hypothetical protein